MWGGASEAMPGLSVADWRTAKRASGGEEAGRAGGSHQSDLVIFNWGSKSRDLFFSQLFDTRQCVGNTRKKTGSGNVLLWGAVCVGALRRSTAGTGLAEVWAHVLSDGESGGMSGIRETSAAQAQNILPICLLARVPRHGILCHWEGPEWARRRRCSGGSRHSE